jgi:hypothetical protein
MKHTYYKQEDNMACGFPFKEKNTNSLYNPYGMKETKNVN